MSKSKVLIAASLALAGALGAGAAQAREDVQWSVTIGSNAPIGVVRAPVYHHPVPVYHQPAPVHPQPRYLPPRHDVDRDGIPNWNDRYDNRRHGGQWQPHDRDGDGVPNRNDRYDNRRYPGR